jgi:hypothetical protein
VVLLGGGRRRAAMYFAKLDDSPMFRTQVRTKSPAGSPRPLRPAPRGCHARATLGVTRFYARCGIRSGSPDCFAAWSGQFHCFCRLRRCHYRARLGNWEGEALPSGRRHLSLPLLTAECAARAPCLPLLIFFLQRVHVERLTRRFHYRKSTRRACTVPYRRRFNYWSLGSRMPLFRTYHVARV